MAGMPGATRPCWRWRLNRCRDGGTHPRRGKDVATVRSSSTLDPAPGGACGFAAWAQPSPSPQALAAGDKVPLSPKHRWDTLDLTTDPLGPHTASHAGHSCSGHAIFASARLCSGAVSEPRRLWTSRGPVGVAPPGHHV